MKTNTNHQNPHYFTFNELETKYQAQESTKDLFDFLLHEKEEFHADAESCVKMEEEKSVVEETRRVHQHQGCKCSKIGCLKLYCECFANGKQCGHQCICSCCENRFGNEIKIYEAKMLTNFRHPGHFNGVPALIPVRKCTCKKSMCQKKYCECYNAGEKCGEFCECKDCQNGQFHSHEEEEEHELMKIELGEGNKEIEVPA